MKNVSLVCKIFNNVWSINREILWNFCNFSKICDSYVKAVWISKEFQYKIRHLASESYVKVCWIVEFIVAHKFHNSCDENFLIQSNGKRNFRSLFLSSFSITSEYYFSKYFAKTRFSDEYIVKTVFYEGVFWTKGEIEKKANLYKIYDRIEWYLHWGYQFWIKVGSNKGITREMYAGFWCDVNGKMNRMKIDDKAELMAEA